jgi:hypothetical protein
MVMRRACVLAVVLVMGGSALVGPAHAGRQFVATESDFECVTNWAQVGNLRVHHAKRKKLKKAVRILTKDKPGRKLPVGTIIQLVPFEAMVKRGKGFNPEVGDWEFFTLRPRRDGTDILSRGQDAVNFLGGGCVVCHQAAADFDFVCRDGHGCVDIPLDDELIRTLQEGDARCAS